jgi:hypothetical protein
MFAGKINLADRHHFGHDWHRELASDVVEHLKSFLSETLE